MLLLKVIHPPTSHYIIDLINKPCMYLSLLINPIPAWEGVQLNTSLEKSSQPRIIDLISACTFAFWLTLATYPKEIHKKYVLEPLNIFF